MTHGKNSKTSWRSGTLFFMAEVEDYGSRDKAKSLSSAGEYFHDTQEQKGSQDGDDS